MNLLKLSFSYLKRRALNTLLNVLLLSFGIATIVVLLLFSYQLEDNLYKNAEGVDAVVGAKGSPVQLILSGIFHIDAPTGNVNLKEARDLMNHPMVASAIPQALGDNYRGYRIVGTTSAYSNKYGAELAEGTLWDHEFEVVLGADVARNEELGLGDVIVSSHGFAATGHTHDDHDLHVVGIFHRTGTVLDRLILTGVETMWGIHEPHTHEIAQADEDGHSHSHNHSHNHDDDNDNSPDGIEGHNHHHTHGRDITDTSYLGEEYDDEQITTMLIQYRNPLAAAQFPRFVNDNTSMQAAAPAIEITRLLNLLGVGLDAIQIFAYILILASVLGIFIALINSMKERKYDLAIMRSLGGSRTKLFMHVILEGLLISLAGGLLGIFLGHAAVEGIGIMFDEAQQFAVTGRIFIPGEAWIIALAAGIGLISSIVPAIQAYNTDIAKTLSKS
ncbi:MAG: ABC transporter permease [Balneolaceae bacterium]|nr:MAG: ABC transporter permease [Balneolaceae bacterium]